MTDENTPVDGEELDPFNAFLDNLDNAQATFDPTRVISIRSTSAGAVDVPATEPMTISAVLAAANLTVGQSMEYYVGGNLVQPDFVVAPGAEVTAVGLVKGG